MTVAGVLKALASAFSFWPHPQAREALDAAMHLCAVSSHIAGGPSA